MDGRADAATLQVVATLEVDDLRCGNHWTACCKTLSGDKSATMAMHENKIF